jgi:hypothetical protein
MKTLIEVYKDGKYFVAMDLLTNVADQGHQRRRLCRTSRKGLGNTTGS